VTHSHYSLQPIVPVLLRGDENLGVFAARQEPRPPLLPGGSCLPPTLSRRLRLAEAVPCVVELRQQRVHVPLAGQDLLHDLLHGLDEGVETGLELPTQVGFHSVENPGIEGIVLPVQTVGDLATGTGPGQDDGSPVPGIFTAIDQVLPDQSIDRTAHGACVEIEMSGQFIQI